MDRIPKPGEFYRHFKNKMYQVLTLAIHSETGERMVVYQALYGEFSVYVRPLMMFLDEVDRNKYPNSGQMYRFERVIPGDGNEKASEQDHEKLSVNPKLLEFLDADTYGEKYEILRSMRGTAGQREMDSLYLSLDVKPYSGTVEEQLDNLAQYLKMQQRFDASRLRRS